MPPLKLVTDTTEATLVRALAVADQHNQASPVHPVKQTTEPAEDPVSSRSSYYVSSPVRDAVIMDFEEIKSPKDYDDAKSTVSSKSKRSLFSKLRPSRSKSVPTQVEITYGRTDRLSRFTSFKGLFGSPIAGESRRAAEERMLKERCMTTNARSWLTLWLITPHSTLMHMYWM